MKSKKQIPDLENPKIDEISQDEEKNIAQDALERTKITPTERLVELHAERISELKDSQREMKEEHTTLREQYHQLSIEKHDINKQYEVLKERTRGQVQNMGISVFLASGGGGFLALSQTIIGLTLVGVGILIAALVAIKEYRNI